MIEASPYLQKQQAQLLSGNEDLKKHDLGLTNTCKYLPGVNIVWCEDLRFVPKGKLLFTARSRQPDLTLKTEETATPFILAHEFFDALPIHIFQNEANSSIPASSTIMTPTGPIKPKHGALAPQNQWHELVVTPINSPLPITTASPEKLENDKMDVPEFQLSVSKSPTPHSLYLPQTSARYKALAKTPGAIIEISPESLSYVSDFAERIGGSNPAPPTPTESPTATLKGSTPITPFTKEQPSGAALILDYGTADTIPANTLRGIRAHKRVSPFAAPGTVDLSADVDFLALAESALDASPGVEVHGPVDQAFFLETMGIRERVERLRKAAQGDEEKIKRLETGWTRLVDRGPTGMGKIYKALAIVPYLEGKAVRRPVGFGGNVVG